MCALLDGLFLVLQMAIFVQNIFWFRYHGIEAIEATMLFALYLSISSIGVVLGLLSFRLKNRIGAIASATGRAILMFSPLLLFIVLSADWALGLYVHLLAILWLPISAALFVGLAAIREYPPPSRRQ